MEHQQEHPGKLEPELARERQMFCQYLSEKLEGEQSGESFDKFLDIQIVGRSS